MMTIFRASVCGFALASALPAAVLADSMTLTHHFPPTHFLATAAAEPFVQCVEAEWDGDLEVNVYGASQLHAAKNALDALHDGLADVSPVAMGYVSAAMPLTGIVMLPGLADTSVGLTTALRRNLTDGGPIAEEFAAQGIRPLFINMSPAYQMMSRGEPVRDPEGFKGKTWRSGGGTMNVAITSLGGSPAEMPGGDMYVALQRGAMDGTILSSISVKPYNTQEVVKSMSSNAKFGQYATIFVVRAAYYDGLSEANKAVIDNCGAKVEEELAIASDKINDELYAEFAAGGVEVYTLTEDAVAAFDTALQPVIDDYIARVDERGLPGKEAYDQLKAALGN